MWFFHSNRLRHLHTYYLLVKRRRNPSITYSTVEIFLVRISVSIMASNAVMFISQVDTFRMTCLTINGNFCSVILSPVPISLIRWATSTPNVAIKNSKLMPCQSDFDMKCCWISMKKYPGQKELSLRQWNMKLQSKIKINLRGTKLMPKMLLCIIT